MSVVRRTPAVQLGAWVAFALPLAVAIGRMTGEGHWSDDLAAVRALNLMQVGAEGLVSSALASAWAMLPVGDRLFRLGLSSALLVGLAGTLTYQLCFSLLDRSVVPWLRALVALAAAFSATLGPLWQACGAGIGRGALAECLLLASTLQARRARDPKYWLAQALIIGLLCAEKRNLVPAALGIALVGALVTRSTPSPRQVWHAFALLGLTLTLTFLPSLLEMLGPPRGLRLGFDLDLPKTRALPGGPLLEEVGWYAAGLAGCAVAFSAWRGNVAALAAPLFAFGCGLLLPRGSGGGAAAVSALSALAGFGFLRIAVWLSEGRVSFARSALGLSALLHLCSVLLIAEDSRRVAERQSVNGTRAWSREAFGRLPARSLLLVRSPDAVWRLLASQAAEGTRPDVVIVPAPLLTHGTLAQQLLTIEPRLTRLIRDLAVSGAASEYALSEVADARPLRVELDADWSQPVLSHLVSDGLWFRLAPEALGRSDRAYALGSLEQARERIFQAAATRRGRDEATLTRLLDDVYAHAVVMAALGESKSARRVLADLERVAPGDARWQTLSGKLEAAPNGFAELADLTLRR
jgi:hypothetical protein